VRAALSLTQPARPPRLATRVHRPATALDEVRGGFEGACEVAQPQRGLLDVTVGDRALQLQ